MPYLMGQGEKQMLHLHQGSCMVELQDHSNYHKQYTKHGDQEDQWKMIMEDEHHDTCHNNKNNIPSSLSSSFEGTSTSSNGSSSSSSAISSSSDLVNDDDDDDDGDDDICSTSSSHSPSSSDTNGPLYELSDLMAQLPIKRGLSKFYQGKSQSYTSLSRVMSLEDLAKKETPYRKKMKSCKSYGGGLDAHKSYTLPKATIAKKVSRGSSFSSLSFPGRKSTFLGSCRPPSVPVQKHF